MLAINRRAVAVTLFESSKAQFTSNEDLKGPEYQNSVRVVSLTYLFS